MADRSESKRPESTVKKNKSSHELTSNVDATNEKSLERTKTKSLQSFTNNIYNGLKNMNRRKNGAEKALNESTDAMDRDGKVAKMANIKKFASQSSQLGTIDDQNNVLKKNNSSKKRLNEICSSESDKLANDNPLASAHSVGGASEKLLPNGNNEDDDAKSDITKKSSNGKRKDNKKQVKLKTVEFLNTNVNDQSKLSLIENQSTAGDSSSTKSSNSKFSFVRSCYDYSYVILAASFVAYMLASLFGSCFGVFFETMDADLGWSKSQVAFIGAALTALQDLTGPIASAVTNKYGCRRTAILGGLIASLSVIGSSYIENFWIFSLLMGVLSGFGTSLVLVSSVVVVTYYFEDKPSFAAGLTISGASFGQSIFTMILIKLNEIYGRSGCFLILGAILMNMVVCGALYRPLPWELLDEDESEEDEEEEDDEEEDENETTTDLKAIKAASGDLNPAESNNDQTTKKKILKVDTRQENDDDHRDDENEKSVSPLKKLSLERLINDYKLKNGKAPLAKLELYESSANESNFIMNFNPNHEEAQSNQNLEDNQSKSDFITMLSQQYFLPDGFLQRENKSFSSDPYLTNRDDIEMPTLGNTTISNSMYIENTNRLSDEARDQIMDDALHINRHHSLEVIGSDKKKSMNELLGHSFIPTDTQSLRSFRSNNNDMNRSTFMLGKDHMHDQADQQISLQNGDFVVINADDIENCGSNLMIASPNGDLYLPIISNFDENNNFLSQLDMNDSKNSLAGIYLKEIGKNDSYSMASNKELDGSLADRSLKTSNSNHYHHQYHLNDSSGQAVNNETSKSHASLKINEIELIPKAQASSQQAAPAEVNKDKSKRSGLFSTLISKFKMPSFGSNKKKSADISQQQQQTATAVKKPEPTQYVALPTTQSQTTTATIAANRPSNPVKSTVFHIDNTKNNRPLILKSNQQQQQSITPFQTGFNLPNSHKLIKHTLYDNPVGSKMQRKALLLNRCNCYQRHLQQQAKQSQRAKSEHAHDLRRSTSKSDIASNQLEQAREQQQQQESNEIRVDSLNEANNGADKIQTIINISSKLQQTNSIGAHKSQQSGTTKSASAKLNLHPKHIRHYPNCPYYYMNQSSQNPKANLYYVPNLFQNSYRFPLHFKNVYYYKSLVNLNMRLMVVKPQHHGSHTNAMAGVVNLKNNDNNEIGNVSLSCPDLQLKQLLIMNNTNNSNNKQNLNLMTSHLKNSGGARDLTNTNKNSNIGGGGGKQFQIVTLKDWKLLQASKNFNKFNSSGGKSEFGPLKKNNQLLVRVYNPNTKNNYMKAVMQPNGSKSLKIYQPNPMLANVKTTSGVKKSARSDYMANINDLNNRNTNLKILNAGSIILSKNPIGSNNKLRRDSLSTKRKPTTHVDEIKNNETVIDLERPLINKHLQNVIKGDRLMKPKYSHQQSIGVDDELVEYSDKILADLKNRDEVFFDKEKLPGDDDEDEDDEEEDDEEDDEEEEDEEEDDEEDEDEDDEDDEEEEEVCDNCFTRTRAGGYVYRYLFKPVYKPLKYIAFSVMENLKLFRLFKFCIFALCNFILSLFYESPFYFINSYMTENDLTQKQAGTVTVAVGIVSVFSSIAYGYIGDSKRINSIVLYSVSLILCGLCNCAIPWFIKDYWATMILMVLVGGLISVSDVLVPVICVNIVGYDDFVNAYGLMFFCQGLASLSGPTLLGLIVDYSGSYALSFYLIGLGIMLSGLILTLILVYNKCERKDKKKLEPEKVEKA